MPTAAHESSSLENDTGPHRSAHVICEELSLNGLAGWPLRSPLLRDPLRFFHVACPRTESTSTFEAPPSARERISEGVYYVRSSVSRFFTASRSRSTSLTGIVSTELVATGLIFLGSVSTGCGTRGESSVADRSSALASATPSPLVTREGNAARTREGHASQLLQLARDVGAMKKKQARPNEDAGTGPALPEPSPTRVDAGADAGPVEPPSPDPTDPGELPEPAGDAAAPPTAPPPVSLPRDIVAQSALPIYGLEAGVILSESALWDRLASSSAVCFGEFHDVPAHHYAETRALDELAARAASTGHTFAVGFEMIQRPYQAPLSAFVAGELGEDEFLAQTEYFTRWGYDVALYRPLFEGAREHQLPALALNMRAEITRKIGRTGLQSLDAAELAELPELNLADEEHRAYIFGLFGVLPEHAAELGLEDIYVAQTVWDETMADTSARWLAETGESARLLDIAGGAHCHRSAIPRRITRRLPNQPALSVHAVFESELTDGTFTPEGYDILVVLDD
jgi:uncharacterized iron-regulated protein